jgi:hypothetical protein
MDGGDRKGWIPPPKLAELGVTICLFPTATPKGPAYGEMQHMTWATFTGLCQQRREGEKDGQCFVPATFRPEPEGRVRRLSANLSARTAIALDIETNKVTGEAPPSFDETTARIEAEGWAGVIYTSYSHTDAVPRYRITLPLTSKIDFALPAVQVIADALDLSGVLDVSKLGAASVFYLPSSAPGQIANHRSEIIDGAPIDAAWLIERAGAILAAREAEQARQRADALAAAERRREERRQQGYDDTASVIEAIRDRLDLTGELLKHGYVPTAGKSGEFLYSDSKTRVPGVHVMRGRDGIERVFSHHSGDPLAPGNLPSWCTVRAIDAVDVKIILDFGGDRKAALRTLAKQFGIKGAKPRTASGTSADPCNANGAAETEPPQTANGQPQQEATDLPDGQHDEVESGDAEPPEAGVEELRSDASGDGEAEPSVSAQPEQGASGMPSGANAGDGHDQRPDATPPPLSVSDAAPHSKGDGPEGDDGTGDSAGARVDAQQGDPQEADADVASDLDRVIETIQTAKPPRAAIKLAIDAVLQRGLPSQGIDETRLLKAAAAHAGINLGPVKAELKAARQEQNNALGAERRAIQQAANEWRKAERKEQLAEQRAKQKAEHQARQAEQKAREKAAREAEKARLQAEHQRQRAQRQEQRDPSIAELIEEFNAKYFIANEAGKAMVWQPTHDHTLDDRIYYQHSRVSDLRIFYMNRMIETGETKKGTPVLTNVADVWLEHQDRKQYIGGVEFDPSGADQRGVYNLWEGLAIQPKPGSWRLMRAHLRNIVCAGNEAHYRYLRRWLARAVRFPAKHGEIAIVMRGQQGCGKSILGVALCRIFGQHGFAISHAVHLVGKFNLHLRDTVVLFADEAFFPGDRQHIGTLNAIITQPYLTIEGKGRDIVLAPNFIHLLMASNEDWVVPASLDARRFFVLDVLPDKVGDRAYFDALWRELENGGLEAMFHDLLQEDLTGFNHRAVPDTVGLQHQKRLSLPTEYLWWEEALQRGYVFKSRLGLEYEFREWLDPIAMDLLYDSYREFAREKHEWRPLSREDLGRFLVKVTAKPTRRRGLVVGEHLIEESGLRHAKTVVATDREYGYVLGDLEVARAGFVKATGLPIAWQDQVRGHEDDPD